MLQQNTIAKLYICYTAIFTYKKIIRKIGCKPRSLQTKKYTIFNYLSLLIRMSLVRVQLPEPQFTPSCQRAVFVWISKLFQSSIMPVVKHAIFLALCELHNKKVRVLSLFCILSILRLFVVAYFLTLCILHFILDLYPLAIRI